MYRKSTIPKKITVTAMTFLLFVSSLSVPAQTQARTRAAAKICAKANICTRANICTSENIFSAVNTVDNGKEAGFPSEPASLDELDLVFSDFGSYYPNLTLSPANTEPAYTVPAHAVSAQETDETISAQTYDFLNTLFEESIRALNGLALSMEHFSKIDPNEGRILAGVCEQFTSNLTDFRTEAYLEGKKDRNSTSPLSAETLEAIYEKNTLLEEAVSANQQ